MHTLLLGVMWRIQWDIWIYAEIMIVKLNQKPDMHFSCHWNVARQKYLVVLWNLFLQRTYTRFWRNYSSSYHSKTPVYWGIIQLKGIYKIWNKKNSYLKAICKLCIFLIIPHETYGWFLWFRYMPWKAYEVFHYNSAKQNGK